MSISSLLAMDFSGDVRDAFVDEAFLDVVLRIRGGGRFADDLGFFLDALR